MGGQRGLGVRRSPQASAFTALPGHAPQPAIPGYIASQAGLQARSQGQTLL